MLIIQHEMSIRRAFQDSLTNWAYQSKSMKVVGHQLQELDQHFLSLPFFPLL